MLKDLQFGFRMLAKNPGVSLIAVITLALGIGANTAIFSVVSAVLLRPLPFAEPAGADSIVMVWETNPKLKLGFDDLPASPGDFEAWRDQTRTFESISALGVTSHNLTGSGEPARIGAANVSASFFDVIGVKPRIGRAFLADEDRPGAERVVVVSHSLWQSRFGGDPTLVGKAITLDGAAYTVV